VHRCRRLPQGDGERWRLRPEVSYTNRFVPSSWPATQRVIKRIRRLRVNLRSSKASPTTKEHSRAKTRLRKAYVDSPCVASLSLKLTPMGGCRTATEERSLILMLMRVHGIAEQRTFGSILMRVTMSKRHMAYVETAYSPCQFGIGRLVRFNRISHKGEKGCRQSLRPLVSSLSKNCLAPRAENRNSRFSQAFLVLGGPADRRPQSTRTTRYEYLAQKIH
jgi:hypothetical protein